MASRLELQSKLEELLGSRNVYYQPPENFKINYPAIIYSKSDIDSTHANNINYVNFTLYQIIVVDSKPDNEVIKKILELLRGLMFHIHSAFSLETSISARFLS